MKSVIFDLDGTLVDSKPEILSSFQKAWEKTTQKPLDIPSIKIGLPLNELFDSAGGVQSMFPDFSWLMRKYYDDACGNSLPFPMAKEILCDLKSKGVNIFCATFKPVDSAVKVLSLQGLSPFFDGVYGVDSRSPDYTCKSEMLYWIMKSHGLNPENCTMVGDAETDFQGAQICGMDFIFAAYGYGKVDAKKTINSLHELLTLI